MEGWMDVDLNGAVVLVTGAGSGLGEATARAFAGAGYRVVCLDLDGDAAARTASDLADALPLACDVADPAAVVAAIATVSERFERIDIAVNCAAIDYTLPIEELTVEQWDRVLDVNLRGPFLLARAVWPIMRRQRAGQIFNVASTAAVRAWANTGPYHASKWGLVGFSRGLGVEGREYGIRVTTIIPGGMRTHFFDRFVEQGIPLPDPAKLQDPATVAAAIVFAARVPPESVLQELILTPLMETSWP
jgi:NAD(P)-dependent dehydrogenase (short-subunit alcohol dehydrogenase family)